MSYVVIEHHHDPEAGVYKLIIGREIFEDRYVLDADDTPLLDDNEQPVTEPVLIGHEDVRDYVFADDDKRWAGKSDAKIAEAQRADVLKALTKVDVPDAPPADSRIRQLPGSGEKFAA